MSLARDLNRVVSTLQMGLISLADTGVMATANLARPYYAQFNFQEDFPLENFVGIQESGYPRSHWPQLRALMKGAAAVGGSVLLYTGLTAFFLRAAQFTAARRGFMA